VARSDPTRVLVSGWGRTSPTCAALDEPHDPAAAARLLQHAPTRGALARGLGRSYGDAAQNAGGRLVSTRGLRRIGAFDDQRGTIVAEAGVSLRELTAATLPHGWLVAVTPGTAEVTVGGAIAADVHGKNHHRDGGFCAHVGWLDLLLPSGETVRLDPSAQPEAFAATAGGLGLTGIVLAAELRLLHVETGLIAATRERVGDIDRLVERMAELDRSHRYSVAWVDLVARGSALGRGVLDHGDHAGAGDLAPGVDPGLAATPTRVLPAPRWAPGRLLGRRSAAAFNELWWLAARRTGRELVPLRRFFYPLDGVRDWNRLYGSRGLVQHQFVVPDGRLDALRTAVERIADARAPACLAVLKRLGPQAGPLAFPLAGWTLAVDYPARWDGLRELVVALDELVAEAGGRVYLAKDSTLRPELLPRMYPRLAEWRAARERLDPGGTMRSDLQRRLALS
jgi:decaprenylphospho-beta-D-ribofuranose 2-oxidase